MSEKTVLETTQELSTYLKERYQFFRYENARMEQIVRRLRFLQEEHRIPVDISEVFTEIKTSLSNLDSMAEMFQSQRLRKCHNYISKLKFCIKIYVDLNEKLSEDIKVSRRELEYCNEKLGGILNLNRKQILQLEEKAKRYENELKKFEKKYPWLKDPMFDLPNISKAVQKLQNLKDRKANLVEELNNKYEDLKPDFREARQQLTAVLAEHKKITTELFD